MNIVLNELDYAVKALQDKSLGSYPSITLCYLAKYYREQGYTWSDVHTLIEDFIKQCAPSSSMVVWSNRIDRAIKQAKKYPILKIDYIEVTDNEIKTIRNIKGVLAQRLAFTLLCLSKYMDAKSVQNMHWVNTSHSDIMKIANIDSSIKRQCELISQLQEGGYIFRSKKINSNSLQVLLQKEGKPVMRITDFRNLGFQYMIHVGDPRYLVCENCGLVVRANNGRGVGRKQKYCRDCAQEVKTRQQAAHTAKIRAEKKALKLATM